jgi:hypothetical protein
MRGRFGHRIMKHRRQARFGLFPVAPTHLAVHGVAQCHAQHGAKFAPGAQALLILPDCGPILAGLPLRIPRDAENKHFLIVGELLAKGQLSAALESLQQQGRMKEIPGTEERIRTIAKSYVESPEKTSIVSPDNTSRRELNVAVRSDLINSRFAYVSVSRASHDAQIYTNNASALVSGLSHDATKTSAVEMGKMQICRKPSSMVWRAAGPGHCGRFLALRESSFQ